jgi:hypothetical protein
LLLAPLAAEAQPAQTASSRQALGLRIPESVLQRADEVIQ